MAIDRIVVDARKPTEARAKEGWGESPTDVAYAPSGHIVYNDGKAGGSPRSAALCAASLRNDTRFGIQQEAPAPLRNRPTNC